MTYKKALSFWPNLKDLSDELIKHYPLISHAWHRLIFDEGRVTLTLLIGDVNEALPKLKGVVDAWFLDGFSPAKNPDMWQTSLFKEMAKHSHAETTFATFTSAGEVRRGLQSANFEVLKAPGFGKKREMLFGQYQGAANNKQEEVNSKTVIVIGGGLAGAASAEAMARRGYQVMLIERHSALAPRSLRQSTWRALPSASGRRHIIKRPCPSGFSIHIGTTQSHQNNE